MEKAAVGAPLKKTGSEKQFDVCIYLIRLHPMFFGGKKN